MTTPAYTCKFYPLALKPRPILIIPLILIATLPSIALGYHFNQKLQTLEQSYRSLNGENESLLKKYEVISSLSGETERLYYPVRRVIDGDTIEVKIGSQIEQVRLLGINTPEIGHEAECFGLEAEDFLKKILTNQSVFLLADYANTDRDIYDRLLRYVYLKDNTQINTLLIKEGYARIYDNFPIAYSKFYRELEKTAQSEKRGIWSTLNCPLL